MRSTAELQEIESVDSLFTDIYIILYFSIYFILFSMNPSFPTIQKIFTVYDRNGFFIHISPYFFDFLFRSSIFFMFFELKTY